MENLIIIIIGIVFGLLISYAGLNKYNTIAGLSVLKDFTVAKTIMLVIGLGSIVLMAEMAAGEAVFHVKALYLVGMALGGIIFGIGMAILGYCPGTLPISLGQGSLDALWGIIGGLAGGILYTALYPVITPLLGENLGKGTLFTQMGDQFSTGYIIAVILIGTTQCPSILSGLAKQTVRSFNFLSIRWRLNYLFDGEYLLSGTYRLRFMASLVPIWRIDCRLCLCPFHGNFPLEPHSGTLGRI